MALRRGPQRPKLKTPDDVMTLTDHLGELRVRIIRSALAITLFAILIIAFYDPVLDFLMRPYEQLCQSKPAEFCGASIGADGQTQLFNFDPVEGLATRIRIGMYGGLILATPVVLWQVWQFIVPALHRREKRLAVPFIAVVGPALPARWLPRLHHAWRRRSSSSSPGAVRTSPRPSRSASTSAS